MSLWEIIVKNQLGKLPLSAAPHEYVPKERLRHGISGLALEEADVRQLTGLPALHRDPFDRMLICQALHRGMLLVTSDEVVQSYPVTTL